MHLVAQRALFCSACGAPPAIAGLCRRCYWRARHSHRSFAGHREAVLARDGYRCQACGAPEQHTVHHRRPGVHAPAWLLTLCPACHAVIHRLHTHRRWLPGPLLQLWCEQHPAVPVQWQLAIDDAVPARGREEAA
jgi:hypothetical protein